MAFQTACLLRLYLLAALSTLLLAMGESMEWYAVLILGCTLLAYVFTERTGRFHLDDRHSNGLAIIAIVLFLSEYLWQGIFPLAAAHLAVYLQLIVLFQKKQLRNYWHLALLALMQIPVAAVMNLKMWFGLLLIFYLFIAIFTMTLFYLYRESITLQKASLPFPDLSKTKSDRLWPLSSMSSVFRNGVIWESSDRSSLMGLRWTTGLLGIFTLPLAIGIFVLSPRAPTPDWGQPVVFDQYETGYDEVVRVGEMGQILESDEPVMQVTFRDGETDHQLQPGDLLFRGSTLLDYKKGLWAPFKEPRPEIWWDEPRNKSGLLVQEIELQPIDSQFVFAAWPVRSAMRGSTESFSLRVDPPTGSLMRPKATDQRVLRYRVFSPKDQVGNPWIDLPLPRGEELKRSLEIPSESLPKLVTTARQLTAEVPENEIARKARLLESHLLSDQFSYVLQQYIDNPSLDPVEDFLMNRKSGHCEYFASALTLMCRSIGIPARVVFGFRGVEWNRIGQFYEVKQIHAQTWVEAYIPYQGWLTLDPTPSQIRALPARSFWVRLREFRTYVQALWSRHVVGFDARQQQVVLSGPLLAMIHSWQQWGQRQLVDTDNPMKGRIPWELAFMLFGMVLLVIGATTLWKTGRPSLKKMKKQHHRRTLWERILGRTQKSNQHIRVDFYDQLITLLQKQHWVRQPEQTPQEFAKSIHSKLYSDGTHQPVAMVPETIVRAYYQIRYGGKSLSKESQRHLQHCLDDLSHNLGQAYSSNKHQAAPD